MMGLDNLVEDVRVPPAKPHDLGLQPPARL
jgi:hypothetical protein